MKYATPLKGELEAAYLSMPKTPDGHVVSLFYVPARWLPAYEAAWREWLAQNAAAALAGVGVGLVGEAHGSGEAGGRVTQAARWLTLRNPPRHPESDLQRAVVQYWSLQYPKTWRWTFHCPSGVAIDPKRAAIFRGLGWKRGIPDLLCFVGRGGYRGLALELKAAAQRKLSDDQQLWLDGLEAEGWRCGVFHDLAACGDFIDRYHAA